MVDDVDDVVDEGGDGDVYVVGDHAFVADDGDAVGGSSVVMVMVVTLMAMLTATLFLCGVC